MGYNFQNNISVKVTSTTTIDLNMNTQIRNNRGPKNSVDDLFKMMLSSNPINFPVRVSCTGRRSACEVW